MYINLPKVTQLVRDRTRIQTQVSLASKPISFAPHITAIALWFSRMAPHTLRLECIPPMTWFLSD